ncbi:MAG TPA: FtsX-like permease family protein [Cyclobacteriaceae bacterium]|nr:FtsX-like permease family protein [Cyclobacteriaceae bacterium]
MIRNYFTIAIRNFLRNKNYTLVNILGLSIGITSCIIIFLLITYDLRFDKFHSNYKRIYRVVREVKSASGIQNSAVTPYPFARAFREDFSDIPLVTQFHFKSDGFVSLGVEKQEVEEILFADSMFFDVFDFGVISGNPSKDLGEPNKAFLTESLAAKLRLATGDKIRLDNKLELDVVGIVKDPPRNSHIRYTMVISMPSFTKEFFGWPVDHWGLISAGFSYLVLPENVSEQQITNRFKDFVKKYYEPEEAQQNTYQLQSLKEIHFDTRYSETPGHVPNVKLSDLFVLGVLGLFILIIACINFINLATALAVKKSKEIGIRKTLGARRIQLTTYFLTETLILTLFSIVISLGLVEWTLPWLRGFVEKELYVNLYTDPSLIIFLILLTFAATLFSGFYPAIILSGFDPVAVLKNKITAQGSSSSSVRRMLIIFQFIIAQVMIIGTLVVTDQMKYFNSKPLGFNQQAIVNVSLPKNDKAILDNFRTRLESNSSIRHVSFAVGAPTASTNIGTGFNLADKGLTENFGVDIKTVDYYYKDTYDLKLKAGRWFYESEAKRAADTTLKNDERYVFVVNEAAARKLGVSDPEELVNKRISVGLDDISAPVIGVTEDFHASTLRDEIHPIVMVIYPSLYFDAGISITTADMPGTVDFIQKNWNELFPEYYFHYEFLDQHIADLYRNEARQLVLFRIFSGISIFIGCLGLLGLVSFMANQKLKEVGVRKVFGASVSSILFLFSKEFIRLVVIAFLLAAPLSWFIMNKWLENFAYHIDIPWSVFAIGLGVTIVIALLTVSYRSLRAGLANPVDSLRSE